MKFVLAGYGSRGDVEPGVAIGRELLHRGHDVLVAAPDDLVGFAEAVGLPATAFGPELRWFLEAQNNNWTNSGSKQDRVRDAKELLSRAWQEINTTLRPLVSGADLLFTGPYLEEAAANVAEYYDIPFATLHTYPMRANGKSGTSTLPSPLIRALHMVNDWAMYLQFKKKPEDAQRRELGLPKALTPASRRIAKSGSLEIQAYDEICFPGLASEWAKFDGRRPFVGALTTELTTDANDEAVSWIGAGTPPICFGFGSTPIGSPPKLLKMIDAACQELGERALICAGWTDFGELSHGDHVKVVATVNYAEIYPLCRAVVHHGGSGTTAASLRAGVPTLILWTWPEQPLWGAQVRRLGVGIERGFLATNSESLAADLRQILAPEYAARAREFASRMTKPAHSAAIAADLLEQFAQTKRAG